jgi:glycerol-3-phosphate acyltransferase PlsX
MLIKIAVDAMGGDHAPVTEVEGAIQAAREFKVGVILVGQHDRIKRGSWTTMAMERAGCRSRS